MHNFISNDDEFQFYAEKLFLCSQLKKFLSKSSAKKSDDHDDLSMWAFRVCIKFDCDIHEEEKKILRRINTVEVLNNSASFTKILKANCFINCKYYETFYKYFHDTTIAMNHRPNPVCVLPRNN